ncbi:hypothetical protein JCM1841_002915 [Sporobolomyces salmonicolor]
MDPVQQNLLPQDQDAAANDDNQVVQLRQGDLRQLLERLAGLEHAQQATNTAQQEANEQRTLFANLNATLAAIAHNPGGPPAQADVERAPAPSRWSLKVELPTFRGLHNEDVSAWISLVEDQLDVQGVPVPARTAAVSSLLRDEARTWYLQMRALNADHPPAWDDFKTGLKQKYDSPYKADELHLKLDRLKYRDMDDYLRKYQAIVSQLPETEMTLGDKRANFLKGLPADLAHKIRLDRPTTLDAMYTSARDWARIDRLGPSKRNNAPRPECGPRPPPAAVDTFGASSASTTDAMDVDTLHTVEMAAVRCYNCNKLGHFSSDCREPRRTNTYRRNPALPPRQPLGDRPKRSFNDGRRQGSNRRVFQVEGPDRDLQDELGEVLSDDSQDNEVGAPEEELAVLNLATLELLTAESSTLPTYEGSLEGYPLRVLIDSGASSIYINKKFISCKNFNHIQVKPRSVRIANGQVETCNVIVKGQLHLGVDYRRDTYTIEWKGKTYLVAPRINATRRSPIPAVAAIEEIKADHTRSKIVGQQLAERAKEQFPTLFKPVLEHPPKRKWTHDIDTGTAPPIRVQGRPHTPLEHEAISTFVQEALRDGIIEPSISPWSFPLLLVKKADNSLCVCVDFRQLNRVTVKNAYPLPRIDDCYQYLQHARFFTTLDLKSGYWQVQLTDCAAPKTTFTSRAGHFQFKVMPFGLTNAPATFQAMMNDILSPYLDRFVLVYLDDIVIFSKTLAEHQEHVKKVLTALNEHQLVLSEKKCAWAKTSLVYLGHVVDGEGIRTNPAKVDKITSWPKPATITDVRGFINLATYYKHFVKGFSMLMSPLYALTIGSPKKRTAIEWTQGCQHAFDSVKEALARTALLHHPKPFHPFVIDCDASGQNVGAILQQDVDISFDRHQSFDLSKYAKTLKPLHLRPVAYESRRLSPTEQRYPAQECELLAIVHALKHWRGYIEGSPVLVIGANETLKYFRSQRHPSRRLARFIDDIKHFDAVIVYRPGKHQLAADALSRRGDLPEPDEDATPLLANPIDDIPTSPDGDNSIGDEYTTLRKWEDELRKGKGSELTKEVERRGFSLVEEKLVKKGEGGRQLEVATSYEAAKDVAHKTHLDLGHLGPGPTARAITERYWFPRIGATVDNTLSTCAACQFLDREQPGPQPLHPLPAVGAFSLWSLDFVGPLPRTKNGNEYLITAIDHGTNWPIASPIKVADEQAALTMLKFIVQERGTPTHVLTDNGLQFVGTKFSSALRRLKIKQLRTTPYHPETNGRVERFHKTLIDSVAKYCAPDRQDEWDEHVSDALLAIRANRNDALGYSPFYLNFGRDPVLPSQSIRQTVTVPPTDNEVRQYQQHAADRLRNLEPLRRSAADRTHDIRTRRAEKRDVTYAEQGIVIGDIVLRWNERRQSKLQPRWDGPFLVRSLAPNGTVHLETPSGHVLHNLINVSKLKPYRPDSDIQGLWYAPPNLLKRNDDARQSAITAEVDRRMTTEHEEQARQLASERTRARAEYKEEHTKESERARLEQQRRREAHQASQARQVRRQVEEQKEEQRHRAQQQQEHDRKDGRPTRSTAGFTPSRFHH